MAPFTVKDPRGTVDLQVPPEWKCDCYLLPCSKELQDGTQNETTTQKFRILLYSLP